MSRIEEYKCDSCGKSSDKAVVGWWAVSITISNDHCGNPGTFYCAGGTWDALKVAQFHFCSYECMVRGIQADGVVYAQIYEGER